MEQVIYVLWLLWWNRNRCFHDDTWITDNLAIRSNKLLEEFSEAGVLQDRDLVAVGALSWTPSPCQTLKVNTDTTIDNKRGLVILSMVVRDS